ncbi:MAG TPA: aminopeptidase P N-terminal domain-containing protein [Gemmatimonadales bacterium]
MQAVRRRMCQSLIVLAVVASTAKAQVPLPEYAARRAALAATIDSGVVLAFGAVEPVRHWPAFFQSPSFYYLTGFDESDAVLLMVKRGGTLTATMFVPPRNPVRERWEGPRVGPAQLEARFGIGGRDVSELRAAVDSLAAGPLPFYVVTDARSGDYAARDSLTRGASFLARLRREHPWLVVHSLDTLVTRLRARKSPAEIALLRRATEISAHAHREALKAAAPGCGENEIQALLEGTFRRLGGDRPGYGSIVGSGPNATILHYTENERVMRDGELLLIDAATSFGHYSSDVTRTMPVSGRFSPAQRELYQIVRDAQEAFVREIRPGVSYDVGNDSARAVVAKGLVRLGLIESADATMDPPPGMACGSGGCLQLRLFALHGFGGHGIGLEVHDPAQYYQEIDDRFGVGDVFTIEPGLYVSPELLKSLPDTPRNRAMLARIRPAVEKYRGMGVRVEDVYALTRDGLERLSDGVPREIAEIEALMRQREPELPGGGRCGSPRT